MQAWPHLVAQLQLQLQQLPPACEHRTPPLPSVVRTSTRPGRPPPERWARARGGVCLARAHVPVEGQACRPAAPGGLQHQRGCCQVLLLPLAQEDTAHLSVSHAVSRSPGALLGVLRVRTRQHTTAGCVLAVCCSSCLDGVMRACGHATAAAGVCVGSRRWTWHCACLLLPGRCPICRHRALQERQGPLLGAAAVGGGTFNDTCAGWLLGCSRGLTNTIILRASYTSNSGCMPAQHEAERLAQAVAHAL
jgi:hypothetical protein